MNLGKYGEGVAKNYLQSKNFEMVAQNFRFERAEVDLIFRDDRKKILMFVEVKTRRSKTFGEPEESVTEKKQGQIIKSAQGFLMEHPEYDEYDKRFDIVSICVKGYKEEINHIKNAF